MNLDTKLADHVQPTDISSHAREMADRVSREYDDRMQQSMASHQKTVHEALEHGRAELRSVVGPQLWPVWRRLMWREQLAWRERMQPPDGPFRDLAADLRSRKEGIAKFLDGTGVPLERIRQIADSYIALMRKRALTPATRPGYAYPLAGHEGKLRDLLGGPLQANPHRWFHFRPPFASGQMGFHVSRSPQVYRVSVYRQDVELNLATGRVGHQLWVSIINASDLDQANGIVDTQVEFAFRPPTAGKVEAVIQATCGACLHALNVDDEWGVSDSTTDQSNFLMMHVLHPNVSGPSFVKMSHFPWETDNSTHQTHEFLSKGADYFASLVSDGAVAANETVIIRVGTRSDDGAMTNDMSIDSKSTFLWTIKEVSVRIAP